MKATILSLQAFEQNNFTPPPPPVSRPLGRSKYRRSTHTGYIGVQFSVKRGRGGTEKSIVQRCIVTMGGGAKEGLYRRFPVGIVRFSSSSLFCVSCPHDIHYHCHAKEEQQQPNTTNRSAEKGPLTISNRSAHVLPNENFASGNLRISRVFFKFDGGFNFFQNGKKTEQLRELRVPPQMRRTQKKFFLRF